MKTPLEHLEQFIKCPKCNEPYEETKALLLETGKKQTTFHITCEKCRVSTLVSIAMNQFGLVSMGALTDLDRLEAKRLFNGDAISSDQVLAVHHYLKSI